MIYMVDKKIFTLLLSDDNEVKIFVFYNLSIEYITFMVGKILNKWYTFDDITNF